MCIGKSGKENNSWCPVTLNMLSWVFLKHLEDKILFRIYRARKTVFVFTIKPVNRFFQRLYIVFKGIKYDTLTSRKCGSVFKSTIAGFQCLYMTSSAKLGCFSFGRNCECTCVSLGLSVPFLSLNRTLTFDL